MAGTLAWKRLGSLSRGTDRQLYSSGQAGKRWRKHHPHDPSLPKAWLTGVWGLVQWLAGQLGGEEAFPWDGSALVAPKRLGTRGESLHRVST